MGKPTFTPGPWEVVSLSGWGGPFSIRMAYVTETAKPNQTHYGVQSIRRKEDAHLISAAPDLYAALKMARVWLDFEGKYDLIGIDMALAKAEGAK